MGNQKIYFKCLTRRRMDPQQNNYYNFKNQNFLLNLSQGLQELRNENEFLDVTLCCDNGNDQIQAHQVILAACSPLFRRILGRNIIGDLTKPLLYLKGVNQDDLFSLLDFMYQGETSVPQESLNAFLVMAEDLEIQGLSKSMKNNRMPSPPRPPPNVPPPIPPRASGNNFNINRNNNDKDLTLPPINFNNVAFEENLRKIEENNNFKSEVRPEFESASDIEKRLDQIFGNNAKLDNELATLPTHPKFPNSDRGFQEPNRKFPTPDRRFPESNPKFPTPDREFPDLKFPTPDRDFQEPKFANPERGFQEMNNNDIANNGMKAPNPPMQTKPKSRMARAIFDRQQKIAASNAGGEMKLQDPNFGNIEPKLEPRSDQMPMLPQTKYGQNVDQRPEPLAMKQPKLEPKIEPRSEPFPEDRNFPMHPMKFQPKMEPGIDAFPMERPNFPPKMGPRQEPFPMRPPNFEQKMELRPDPFPMQAPKYEPKIEPRSEPFPMQAPPMQPKVEPRSEPMPMAPPPPKFNDLGNQPRPPTFPLINDKNGNSIDELNAEEYDDLEIDEEGEEEEENNMNHNEANRNIMNHPPPNTIPNSNVILPPNTNMNDLNPEDFMEDVDVPMPPQDSNMNLNQQKPNMNPEDPNMMDRQQPDMNGDQEQGESITNPEDKPTMKNPTDEELMDHPFVQGHISKNAMGNFECKGCKQNAQSRKDLIRHIEAIHM